MKFSPREYLRGFMSGFVERVKMGFSIEAMSPLGTASTMSQTNRSRCGCRSGRSGERAGSTALSFVISHTRILLEVRHFTHLVLLSSFHTPVVKIRHFTHRFNLWITLQALRHFTHRDSSFHTPSFVTSHTNFGKSARFIMVFQSVIARSKLCNSILTLFNSLIALRAASKRHRPNRPISYMRPFAPMGRTRAPHHKRGFRTHQKQMRKSERRPCFHEALRPSRTPLQGVGARHAQMLRILRVAPLPLRALAARTALFFFSGSSKGRLRKQINFHFSPRFLTDRAAHQTDRTALRPPWGVRQIQGDNFFA